jgi:O-succinylbenzoic acid--CoA ligase
VMLGGAPADPTLLTRARDAGWPVAPSYGLTQACSAVTVADPGDLETSGSPLPGLRVSIAPDGEILVSGPSVAGGGVLRTGDLGRLERGRPDAEWGEAITAFVVLRGEVPPAELREFCAARLARFKVPKTIEAVAELPRNAAGKLLRRELV